MKKIKILLLDDDASNVKPVNDFFRPFGAEVFFTSKTDHALDNLRIANSDLSLVSLKLALADDWYFLKKNKNNLYANYWPSGAWPISPDKGRRDPWNQCLSSEAIKLFEFENIFSFNTRPGLDS